MMFKKIAISALAMLAAFNANAQEIVVAGQTVMSPQDFGLATNQRSWSAASATVKKSNPRKINENYTMLTGKRRKCSNSGTETVYTIVNKKSEVLRLVMRQYKDGYAFRYELDDVKPGEVVKSEATCFHVPQSANRWMQLYDGPGYEHFFPNCKGGVSPEEKQNNKAKTADGKTRWGYPALIEMAEGQFMLISDSFTPDEYCGSCLTSSDADRNTYTVMPFSEDKIVGSTWRSAWRVVIAGTLADVVESTLITDVAEPCKLDDTSWIETGLCSWIYWAYNHGSQEYSILKDYVDLAVDMRWPYTLVDAEWDVMRGGNIEQLVKYAVEKGVKPMIWYNSSTNWVGEWAPTPQGRLNDADKRDAEFGMISSWGVKGVKIDFFSEDNAQTVSYYRDLLLSAAKHKMVVNFHGGTIPHGWQRTYPNVVTCEAVYGAEWYNNLPVLTNKAACHNATLPFTRNVIGPMDYTPGTFTDSQHPHITSHGHELALPILFESGIQHMPDRPESYRSMPENVKALLSELPSAWDDTKLLSGYPGKYVVMARKKGNTWYIAGINGTDELMDMSFSLQALGLKKSAKATVYTDGAKHNTFLAQPVTLSGNSNVKVNQVRPRGGFVIKL